MANSTVRPVAVKLRMDRRNSRRVCTSIAAVGSSSTSRSGSLTSATANRTRCFCPPESPVARRLARSSMPARRSASGTLSGARCRLALMPTVSPTVASSSSAPPCSIAPIRPTATASPGVLPKIVTPPLSGVVSPSSMSTVVDVPAPFGPSNATTSPGAITRSTPSTARTCP